MNKPKGKNATSLWFSVFLLMALVVFFVSYRWLHGQQRRQAVELSCVSMVTPLIALHHAIAVLEEGQQSQAERRKEMQLTEKVIFSVAIDEATVRLAHFMSEEQPGDGQNSLEQNPKLQRDFADLIALFKRDAPAYMADCLALNNTIESSCAAHPEGSAQQMECLRLFQVRWRELMAKYLPEGFRPSQN